MTEPDRPRISPNPDGGVVLHLPEITYLDTQVWKADVGLTDAGLEQLRALLAAPAESAGVAPDTDRECSASISGTCLREAQSETACDTDDGECVHGGKPATDRAALSAKLWEIAEHHIVAEWICCEPLEPKHTLCAKGYAALGMAKTLLVDSPEAWNPNAPLLDAILSVLPASAGQADRAAVLEEAADAIEHEQDRQDAEQVARFGSLDHECAMQGEAVRAKAAMLRRMAAVPAGSADAGHSGSETAGCGCPSEDDPEHMFGGENCDCIPFTRQEKPPRYLNRPTDTVDMISGWEIGQNCPHHRAAAGQSAGGAHFCGNCEGIDPDTCLTNPDRPVSEARQETNPAQDEAPGQWCKCRSCWGWFIEEHPGEDLDELGRDLAWWSGLPAHRDAPDGVEAGREVVHGCPPDGSGLTPCCGRTPFELPRTDRISSEAPVTCTGTVGGTPQPCSARPCNPDADELCDTHARIKYHAQGEHAFCEPGCDTSTQSKEA